MARYERLLPRQRHRYRTYSSTIAATSEVHPETVDSWSSSCRCDCQGVLIAEGTEHPDRGVTSSSVVPADPIVNRGNEFGLRVVVFETRPEAVPSRISGSSRHGVSSTASCPAAGSSNAHSAGLPNIAAAVRVTSFILGAGTSSADEAGVRGCDECPSRSGSR